MNPDMVILLIDAVLGAIATFVGILLWSLTRDASWMLVIIAAIVRFGEAIFQVLSRLGIFTFGHTEILGIPVFWSTLRATWWILLIIAFALMVRRNRV